MNIGSLLGTAGGAGGTGFSGPQNASIAAPTTAAQATNAYNQNQNALTQQQQFLNAVQAQNGLQNQSNVLNQLQGVANGTGPNPAQAQLAQATGANVANQAALMAGQRGSSQNAGLIARQAAQQGAQTQQQSAGQAATLQANQSLNALGQMGGIAGQQAQQQAAATGALTNAQQSEQGQLLGSINSQNQANVNMQGNVNTANAGLAGQQMGAQGNLLGGVFQGAGSAVKGLLGAEGGKVPKMYAGAGYVQTNDSAPQAGSYAPAGGVDWSKPPPSSVAPAPTPAPTNSASASPSPTSSDSSGPQSSVGKALTGYSAVGNTIGQGIGAGITALFGPSAVQQGTPDPFNSSSAPTVGDSAGSAPMPGQQTLQPQGYAKGGKVPALLSPGERYLTPQQAKSAAQGKVNPMNAGKKIPGKPKVPGAKNSYANDTVKATLEEGGIVIPRSITQGPNPHWEAMRFVHKHMKAKGGKV